MVILVIAVVVDGYFGYCCCCRNCCRGVEWCMVPCRASEAFSELVASVGLDMHFKCMTRPLR